MAEVVVRLLRAVKEFEDELHRVEKELEHDASSLLAAAEERARRLEVRAEEIVDSVRNEVARAVEEEVERVRREMEEKRKEVLGAVEVQARTNFEKAVQAALEVLVNAVRASGR